MKERNIAVLSCGGTIAMMPGKSGSLSPELTGEQLVANIPALGEMDANFDVIDVFNKDSTNVGPEDWTQLTDKIAEVHSDYAGVIVTHGTDTMAYTASATSFSIGEELKIPIVFTGSQLPLNALRTDARVNVESAAQVVLEAAKQQIAETMVVFSHRVMRAARTLKVNESNFDAFDSPAYPNLATLTASDEVHFIASALKRSNLGFSIKPRNVFDDGIHEAFANGTEKPSIVLAAALSEECTGLILRSVGAGNVPSEGKKSFIPVIEKTLEAGKPVIISTSFVGGKTIPEMYEPGKRALDAGAGHAGNMTADAAKVKLMWLMGQGMTDPEKVSEAMLLSVVGEVDV